MQKILELTQGGYNIGTGIFLAKKEGDKEILDLIHKWSKFIGTDEEFTKKYIKN